MRSTIHRTKDGYFLRVHEDCSVTRSDGDCAAWVTVMDVKAGFYPLTRYTNTYDLKDYYYVAIPGVVKFKDSKSRFGGVLIPSSNPVDKDKEAVGTQDAYTMTFDVERVEKMEVYYADGTPVHGVAYFVDGRPFTPQVYVERPIESSLVLTFTPEKGSFRDWWKYEHRDALEAAEADLGAEDMELLPTGHDAG